MRRPYIKKILRFFLPNGRIDVLDSTLEAERTEPNQFSIGKQTVFLENVCLDDKEQLTDKETQFFFVAVLSLNIGKD